MDATGSTLEGAITNREKPICVFPLVLNIQRLKVANESHIDSELEGLDIEP